MRLRQLDDVQHAIELVESGMGWDELNESITTLSEGEKGAIFLSKAKLSEEELMEYVWLAPAALAALRSAGSFAVKRALPAAGRFLKTRFGRGAAAGGGMAGGAEVVDRVVGGNDNDNGPDFSDGFDAGYNSAGGNRKSRFRENLSPEERAARDAEDEKRYKDNPAMLRALRQISATFGPERKKITDQVLAMCRAAEMLTSERWKDRALSQVEAYGIKSKEELAQELELMIKNEKAVDDEYITDTGTNIRNMERALEKISSLSEGWSELPKINREKYQERDGLEGPIMTRSGKVVYYDPKEGSYYDPDTDMYISYDDWRMLDSETMHKVTEKQRLDPKCWDGYKIGNPKTKMKGGVRVNNCVRDD